MTLRTKTSSMHVAITEPIALTEPTARMEITEPMVLMVPMGQTQAIRAGVD